MSDGKHGDKWVEWQLRDPRVRAQYEAELARLRADCLREALRHLLLSRDVDCDHPAHVDDGHGHRECLRCGKPDTPEAAAQLTLRERIHKTAHALVYEEGRYSLGEVGYALVIVGREMIGEDAWNTIGPGRTDTPEAEPESLWKPKRGATPLDGASVAPASEATRESVTEGAERVAAPTCFRVEYEERVQAWRDKVAHGLPPRFVDAIDARVRLERDDG